MNSAEEIESLLTVYRTSLADIIAGKIKYFSKGDTRYTLFNINDLKDLIRETKTELVMVRKGAFNGCI